MQRTAGPRSKEKTHVTVSQWTPKLDAIYVSLTWALFATQKHQNHDWAVICECVQRYVFAARTNICQASLFVRRPLCTLAYGIKIVVEHWLALFACACRCSNMAKHGQAKHGTETCTTVAADNITPITARNCWRRELFLPFGIMCRTSSGFNFATNAHTTVPRRLT